MKDLDADINRHENVTRRIDAAYLGSVEKKIDLFIVKPPIVKSGTNEHLSKRPIPKGDTKSHDGDLPHNSPLIATSKSLISPLV